MKQTDREKLGVTPSDRQELGLHLPRQPLVRGLSEAVGAYRPEPGGNPSSGLFFKGFAVLQWEGEDRGLR